MPCSTISWTSPGGFPKSRLNAHPKPVGPGGKVPSDPDPGFRDRLCAAPDSESGLGTFGGLSATPNPELAAAWLDLRVSVHGALQPDGRESGPGKPDHELGFRNHLRNRDVYLRAVFHHQRTAGRQVGRSHHDFDQRDWFGIREFNDGTFDLFRPHGHRSGTDGPLRRQYVFPKFRRRIDRESELGLVPPARTRQLRGNFRNLDCARDLLRFRSGLFDREEFQRSYCLLHSHGSASHFCHDRFLPGSRLAFESRLDRSGYGRRFERRHGPRTFGLDRRQAHGSRPGHRHHRCDRVLLGLSQKRGHAVVPDLREANRASEPVRCG